MSWLSSIIYGAHPSKQNQQILDTTNQIGAIALGAAEAQNPQIAPIASALQTIGGGKATPAQTVAAAGAIVTVVDPNALAQAEHVIYELVTGLGVEIGEATFDNLVNNTLSAVGITAGSLMPPAPAAPKAPTLPNIGGTPSNPTAPPVGGQP